MKISEEIINLAIITLVSGQHKVGIARELEVSVRTRVCKYKTHMSVKRAMKKISKQSRSVFTKKVCQLLPEKSLPSTIRRRLLRMGYKYRSR